MKNLASEMLAANENHLSRVDDLVARHGLEVDVEDFESFSLIVQNEFFLGVHRAYVDAILDALKTELRTQQQVAAALGLKDRSSISQMLRSGTIDGLRITAALYGFPEISLPERNHAALVGFARATSFIKSLACRDKSLCGTMTAQDFSYLVGVLASNDWIEALQGISVERARDLAIDVIQQRTIATLPNASRPEQYVLMLQELWFKWGDYAVLTLWCIPECIPEDDADLERIA